MKIEEMADKHPYYASESNFYSNDSNLNFETMVGFLDEFEDADIDMNQVFRWDITEKVDDEEKSFNPKLYSAQVVIILQRKGIYIPCRIASVTQEDLPRFQEYLKKHWENMIKIWMPISQQQEVEK